ncbi:hypothetical protein AB1K70_09190 [Bremerella sp. JC770]|uniref:outer membrane protein assembly factor BamB family protein n=1 Tax=Bremerella sp. JC770 TaxID=3232137 RepID=UPI00345849E8
MVGRILLGTVVLMLAAVGQTYAQNRDHWRVTVQDISLHPLAVSADGKLIAGRGERGAETFFHLFDRETSQVRLSVPMPHGIHAAAISADGRWFIVATHEHIYRIDRQDGVPRRLLETVAGAVAIDASGTRLAVHGNLKLELPSRAWNFYDSSQLGVLDLKTGQWIHQVDSPVRKDHVVAFDGDTVIAAGVGGNVRSRKSQGYHCHAQLNIKTGEVTERYGPDFYDAHMNPPQADPAYQFPQAIQKQQSEREAALPRAQRELAHPVGPPGDVQALVADGQRIAAVIDHGDAKRSLLCLTALGELEVRDAHVGSKVEVCRGRIVQEAAGQVTDIESGNQVTRLAQFRYDPKERNQWTRFVGPGWLVRNRDRLSYYVPGSIRPAWERASPENLERFPLALCSKDNLRLVIGLSEEDGPLVFSDAESGKTLLQLPSRQEQQAPFSFSRGALNQDGSKLLVLGNTTEQKDERSRPLSIRRIREYDLASGQMTYERTLGENEYYWSITNTGRAWVLGGDTASLYVDETTHHAVAIPFSSIDLAMPIPGRQDQALLVENTRSGHAIVTPAGQVVRRWPGPWSGGIRNTSLPTPTSGVAFGGKVIARKTGTSEIELLDGQSFDTIAWVHVIRWNQGFAWIAYTPDGYWDASPGAEKFVLVTRDGVVTSPMERQSRRVPDLVKTRLPR